MPLGVIYQLALVATLLFVAPFNLIARAVVLGWLAGHVLWLNGLPEPLANFFGQSCVLIFGACLVLLDHRRLDRKWERRAWLLSLPLMALNVAWVADAVSGEWAWWGVIILAFVQLGCTAAALDRNEVSARLRHWHEAIDRILLRRVSHLYGGRRCEPIHS